MVYLERFKLPKREDEESYFFQQKRNLSAYDSKYPFHVFRYRNLPELEFDTITILCGGNGSGKTTVLNVIAEKLGLSRAAPFNCSSFFEDYIKLCRASATQEIPRQSAIITSDDVFQYLLNTRYLQKEIDLERQKLFSQYESDRNRHYQLSGLDDYDTFARICDAKDKSQAQYVHGHIKRSVQERSNGESALKYFTDHIDQDALYLLDEPENSLSATMQLELKQFLEDSARFYHCQFILSTHSPFLLSIKTARVYDLDSELPTVKPWTELENVITYQQFFRDHEEEFCERRNRAN